MRIGIDARLCEEPRSGIGRYTRSLVDALLRVTPGDDLVLFVDRHHDHLPSRCEVHCIPERRRLVWTLRGLPRALRATPVDVYHSLTGFELPRLRTGEGPALVTTVHDLIPYRFPRSVPWRHRTGVKILLPRALERASRIIAVSEATQNEVITRFGIDRAKIRVVPEAASIDTTKAGPDRRREVRAQYGLDGPYVLFVGLLEPKKNLPALIRAFARARAGGGLGPTRLAIAGAEGWGAGDLRGLAAREDPDAAVHFLGPVADADLPALYAEALAFVFPSLWEGFGLPVLEAMASGTPVIAARRGALPEITGNAALLIEPDETAIAAAISRMVLDAPLRDRLTRAGLERAAQFSWERAARETLDVYREAAG